MHQLYDFLVYFMKIQAILYITHINFIMRSLKALKSIAFLTIIFSFLNACNGKLPGGDARKFPADPAKRVEQNLKEGRGINLNETFKSGKFDFASSNELWRASLDVIEFMPLTSVNYSGGIIVTDWYSDNNSPNESIKISIRFLTNEIRSDALDIKIFNRRCSNNLLNCKISQLEGNLSTELKKEILKKASQYKSKKKRNTKTF